MSEELPETETFTENEEFASQFFVTPKPTVSVQFAATSDTGKVRKKNEDHFAVLHRYRSQNLLSTNLPREKFPAIRDDAYVFVVTDGLGGAACGEMASRVAMEEAWDLSAKASSWVMRFSDLPGQQMQERLNAYAAKIQKRLVEYVKDYPAASGMATTWTSAYVVGWDLVIAHIGDSRAYVYRDGALQQLTQDHTLAQSFEILGIPKDEADKYRHVLTNALDSSGKDATMEVRHHLLSDGDRLLLCTDGLSDLVPEEQISEILGDVANTRMACQSLLDKALELGGKDNVTLILADFTDGK